MENTNGVHHFRSRVPDLPVALDPVGEAVSALDAALHRIDKQLRLNEWRLALLLEALARLNADLAEAAPGLEAGR